ncbi:MAG: hypothetical protein HYX24_03305 [Candidatus Aenigmarchaeota archaeon]|nr:hypothetical protein [Candidatus Aenigmarchaeota archaeon]
MPIVVIAGVPHTEKDSIASIVLSRYSQKLPQITLIHDRLEKQIDMKKNILLISNIFSRYGDSYGLSMHPTVKTIEKEMVVLFELETERPEIREWQELNRAYAAAHFSCSLRFIRVRKGNINLVIKEFYETLKEAFL